MSYTDLKHEILKRLKEDEEFRYAVAGLIGLGEVLRRLDTHEEELKKLREDFNRFIEFEEKRWGENDRKWEENFKRWEENNRRWEEAYKRFEAIELELKKLREDFLEFVKLEERRWEENDRRWKEANKRFSRIELGLGVLTESTYSRYVWEDLREEMKIKGEAILARRRNAVVDNTEVDLLVETDKSIYVVEIKVRPSIEDVGSLISKAEVVEKRFGKTAVPILVGALIGDDVRAYAESRGVKIYSY